MKIKICGLMRMEDVDAVNAVMPDYIGFVFAKRRRLVDDALAKEMAEKLHPDIRRVGVFVDETIERVMELERQGIFDMIQLHGKESYDYVAELKKQTRCQLVKAVRMDVQMADITPADITPAGGNSAKQREKQALTGLSDTETFMQKNMSDTVDPAAELIKNINSYLNSGIDYILLDNGIGGTGERFPWERIPHLDIPYFLAGGIGLQNVREAAERTEAFALDVSSSVETDGQKDPDKIKRLVELVRSL